MPRGLKTGASGEQYFVFTCPCMNGDSKKFADLKRYNMYVKLHTSKCEEAQKALEKYGNVLNLGGTNKGMAFKRNYNTGVLSSQAEVLTRKEMFDNMNTLFSK
jgi:hypothetical protein